MEDFCKLFKMEDGSQFLVTKEAEEKGGIILMQLRLRFRARKKGTNSIILPYKNERLRDQVFDALTEADAQDLYREGLKSKK